MVKCFQWLMNHGIFVLLQIEVMVVASMEGFLKY